MANKIQVRVDDLKGYEGLERFGIIYPTFDIFKSKILTYLIFNQESDIEEKTWQILYNKYKNHFMKWSYMPDVHEEVAKWMEGYITLNKAIIGTLEGFGNIQESTSINVNNAQEGQSMEYPDTKVIIQDTPLKDKAEWELDLKQRQDKLRKHIDEFRFLTMNIVDQTLERETR